VFLHRANSGTGTLLANNVRLNWNYNENEVQSTDTLDLRLFGIEMVYITEGAFYAGDGGVVEFSFRQGSLDNDPWYIGSENAINVDKVSGSGTGIGRNNLEYYILAPNNKNDGYITANSNGGKGSDSLIYRNSISWISGNATLNDDTHGDVACGYISPTYFLSYLDWAALRPMTELEYEKICRGAGKEVVGGEFAWVNTNPTTLTGLFFDGYHNEVASTFANLNFSSFNLGSSRVGMFAKECTTKSQSDSSYYSTIELRGNIVEYVILATTSSVLSFVSINGDDVLNATGQSTTNGNQIGIRRGGFIYYGFYGLVSDRKAATEIILQRWADNRVRGVRSVN
jgi:hypothetical protein